MSGTSATPHSTPLERTAELTTACLVTPAPLGILAAAARAKETPWPDRIEALNAASRACYRHEPSGTPVSLERLRFEAGLIGLSVQSHQTVYRVDTRPPSEIADSGFQPRRDKPSGSLLQHIESKTGNMVSATVEPGNPIVFGGLASYGHLATVGSNRPAELNNQMATQLAADLARFKELIPDPTLWQLSLMDRTTFEPGRVDEMIAKFRDFEEKFLRLPEELRTVHPEYAAQLPRTHEDFLKSAYAIYAVREASQFSGTQTYYAWEYRIEQVSGVAIECEFPGFIFSEQREVTIPCAAAEQIGGVRRMEVELEFQGWHPDTGIILNPKSAKVKAGEWKQLRPITHSTAG